MKPILFNTEMVRAILEGRKTVTRRIANINTEATCNDGTTNHEFVLDNFNHTFDKPTGFVCRKCGYGVAPPHSRVPCGTSLFRPRYWPCDILYVRETWQMVRYLKPRMALPVDFKEIEYFYKADGEIANSDGKPYLWRPSIHMPKEAARIFLRVKSVRVERLQDMGESDALEEGVPDEWPMDPVYCPICKGEGLVGDLHPATLGYREVDCPHCEKAVSRFANLWNSTIKPADLPTYGWEANPWVWVIKFERIRKEDTEL